MFLVFGDHVRVVLQVERKAVLFHADLTLYPNIPKYKITTKANRGTTSDISRPANETSPVSGGSTAPPTIAMITSPEPILTWSPRFLIDSAKMVGNMMD